MLRKLILLLAFAGSLVLSARAQTNINVWFIGDSTAEGWTNYLSAYRNFFYTGITGETGNKLCDVTYLLELHSNGLVRGTNYAVDGAGVPFCNTVLINRLPASGYQAVVFGPIGVNDLRAGTTTFPLANYDDVLLKSKQRGAHLFVTTVLPCGTYVANAVRVQRNNQIRTWVSTNSGVSLVDYEPHFVDVNGSSLKSGLNIPGDNTHLSPEGCDLQSQVLLTNILTRFGLMPSGPGTNYAASCSPFDIATAIGGVTNGGFVYVPEGDCEWFWPLQITKAITLVGPGADKITIRDSIPNLNSPPYLMRWTLPATGQARMTGMGFMSGARTEFHSFGAVVLGGSKTNASRMRIDHCQFDGLRTFNILSYGAIGVIDHNQFNHVSGGIPIYVFGEAFGDTEWATASDFGSEQYLFVENNGFYSPTAAAAFDGFHGAKLVARWNNLTNGSVEVHGTESGQRYRGARAIEVYNNNFYGNAPGGYIVNVRSGGAVVYSNSIVGASNALFHLTNHRNFYPFKPWGGVDGVNPWDKNIAGAPFDTGTVTTIGTRTITVTGKAWPANQWAGYTLRKVVRYTGTSGGLRTVTVTGANWTNTQWLNHQVYKDSTGLQGAIISSTTDTLTVDQFDAPLDFTGTVAFTISRSAEILSNTADTITYIDNGSYGLDLTFREGDAFEINRADAGLDQPGRAGGGLVTGEAPVLPLGWNNQTNDPCYEWQNVRNGSFNVNFSAGVRTIREHDHFENDTERPGYSAYTFPHPLAGGELPPPPPPINTNRTFRLRTLNVGTITVLQ